MPAIGSSPSPSSLLIYWQTILSRHWNSEAISDSNSKQTYPHISLRSIRVTWYWSKFLMDPNTLSIEPIMLDPTGPSLGVKSADVPAVEAAAAAELELEEEGLNIDVMA